MSDADKTPTDGRSTIELVFDDVRAIKTAVQNTETVQLRMYEDLKAYRAEQQAVREQLEALKRERWAPVLLSALAALFCLASALAAR